MYISIINTVIKNQNKKPHVITSSLLGLQSTLLQRTDIKPSDLPVMYSIINGAIASFNYWRVPLEDENNPWNPDTGAQKLRLPGWLKRGIRDLGGFVVGAVVGSVIAGPPGAVAGGTLVGGACSGAK